jgi:hypothetical protein
MLMNNLITISPGPAMQGPKQRKVVCNQDHLQRFFEEEKAGKIRRDIF